LEKKRIYVPCHKVFKNLSLNTIYVYLGPLYTRRQGQKIILINARKLTVRILINAGTLARRLANWLPKFDGIRFSALGQYKAIKFSASWGRLRIFFLFQP
jgi:hypothetical protein